MRVSKDGGVLPDAKTGETRCPNPEETESRTPDISKPWLENLGDARIRIRPGSERAYSHCVHPAGGRLQVHSAGADADERESPGDSNMRSQGVRRSLRAGVCRRREKLRVSRDPNGLNTRGLHAGGATTSGG